MASNVLMLAVQYASLLFNESFLSQTSSVMQKCELRRLIRKNTWKTTSCNDITCLHKVWSVVHQNKLSNSYFNTIPAQEHLNNAYKDQASKLIEYLSLKKVV